MGDRSGVAVCIWALQAGARGQLGWDSLVWRQKEVEMQYSMDHVLEADACCYKSCGCGALGRPLAGT